jgi:hypothetical protein
MFIKKLKKKMILKYLFIILINHIMPKIIGVLKLSSTVSHIVNGKVQKMFEPFQYGLNSFLVSTKKTSKNDMYIIVDAVTLSIIEYIGEIGEINIDKKMLEMCVTCNHIKKYNKLFLLTKNIDLTPSRHILSNIIESYTIDPPGCSDFDDCLSCIRISTGYEVHIMIADPTSYIAEGSECDLELARRSKTLYLEGCEPIHMIPTELSIDYIS